MSIHLKRTVFFFCILCLGFGCCLGNRVDAATGSNKLHLPGILKEFGFEPEREISGFVLENGIGLGGVGIYDKSVQVTVTDSQGYYKFKATHFSYTLIPQKTCYQFTPESIDIPANQFNHEKQNFTAQKQGCITISGKVIWKNYSGDTTIPSNLLPMVAMEAYAQDGSLFSRVVTGVDGKYAIPVPVGWSGWVKPVRLGFDFIPEKNPYSNLAQDQTKDYQAPGMFTKYRVTISVKRPGSGQFTFRTDARGIDHATGSHDWWNSIEDTGTLFWDFYSGWIGELRPSHNSYNFSPAFIRMSKPIASDMTFSFTATPK
jgi:hypothetical protein